MKVLTLLSLASTTYAAAIHLLNCRFPPPAAPESAIAYYENDANVFPGNENLCTFSSTITWEGSAHSCGFSTGVTATSHINSGANNLQTGQFAGTVWNGFQNFNCYKDNGHIQFSGCASIYYCLS